MPRFFGSEDDRLLLVNLGTDLQYSPGPEPLLAPPAGKRWQALWSSEDPAYDGSGTPPMETENGWQMPDRAAVAMACAKHDLSCR